MPYARSIEADSASVNKESSDSQDGEIEREKASVPLERASSNENEALERTKSADASKVPPNLQRDLAHDNITEDQQLELRMNTVPGERQSEVDRQFDSNQEADSQYASLVDHMEAPAPGKLHLEPPPQFKHPIQTSQLSISAFGVSLLRTREGNDCARSRTLTKEVKIQRALPGLVNIVSGWKIKLGQGVRLISARIEAEFKHGPVSTKLGVSNVTATALEKYVVVGLYNRNNNVPVERLKRVKEAGQLFAAIRSASKSLRSLPQRLFSLKYVAGFGIYECHPDKGYHTYVDIDLPTERVLLEFYRDYKSLRNDVEDRWGDWVHEKFNNGSTDPGQGRYSLQLVLRWSVGRITIYVTAPIILSLAIGIWYMQKTGDAEAAWVISTYIVAATTGPLIQQRFQYYIPPFLVC
ncbi:hypothetical protein T310_6947 [Rasamsonia emersonii CBS 393.64]|uniref:Uncharacterized protein n=1 Tax=Rasamsonia emersonii (strain ATCC 16479 / CBS 393.64 / IMI 116815) TaxID=1408163 RepID=A0A0F4YLH6_RASE3|nr:hypothetical protein T310_6947 [Rasamsonia emersonii CBS 393.64]KKA19094.1 hypothetical protein T310_6947 [Rasamsonia emersonii CBS 393.64]